MIMIPLESEVALYSKPEVLSKGLSYDVRSETNTEPNTETNMQEITLDPSMSDSTLIDISYLLPVSIAESVTAGALSNKLCSEPGSSRFFLGGIIAYNKETQEKVLKIKYNPNELFNFANPYTTFNMAKNVIII